MLTASRGQAQTCQPGIAAAYGGPHSAQYQTLYNTLIPAAGPLIAQLAALVDAPTYNTLLTTANALASSISTGRVLIALPDGTVVLDTARDDHLADPTSNSYQHFLDKTIGDNHNSRLAILAAQSYQCGIGLESRSSTSTGADEAYVALRAGPHLDSYGTLVLSTRISVAPPPRPVSIVDFSFVPSTVNVAVGTTVTWRNNGIVEHTTTSTSPGWDSGLMMPGQSFSLDFDTAGTFRYRCDLHPFMVGFVIVE